MPHRFTILEVAECAAYVFGKWEKLSWPGSPSAHHPCTPYTHGQRQKRSEEMRNYYEQQSAV